MLNSPLGSSFRILFYSQQTAKMLHQVILAQLWAMIQLGNNLNGYNGYQLPRVHRNGTTAAAAAAAA